jgi:hypothetical protein
MKFATTSNQADAANPLAGAIFTDHMTTDYDSRSLPPAVADLFLVRRF